MKVHPEVPKFLSNLSWFVLAFYMLTMSLPCLNAGESEGVEGGTQEAVVTTFRQEEAQVDQQGPGAAEGLRGTRAGRPLA